MKNQVILFAIVMGVGCVGCERGLPEEPSAYDSETEPPPSALAVRTDPRVAGDQEVISDEVVKKREAGTAKVETGSEPADEGEATTKPADEGEATTKPADEGEATTKPADEGEATTKPADEGEATTQPADGGKAATRPTTGPATKASTSKPADW